MPAAHYLLRRQYFPSTKQRQISDVDTVSHSPPLTRCEEPTADSVFRRPVMKSPWPLMVIEV